MLDIETLGTRPNAVILTIGAIKFSPYNMELPTKAIYLRPDVEAQVALGRNIDEDTVRWWETQEETVREEALSEDNRDTLDYCADEINRFFVGTDKFWAQGPAFDYIILEDWFRSIVRPTPWQYWQVMDSRTLFGVHGDPRIKNKEGLHNALEDCVSQAQGVQQVYKEIGKHYEN